ncbi:related to mitochondrial serine--tRNA ligase [Cephalotrichum gorgonifer]|uniref:serine--tRNA ligase n=1 Tax=Cephalotrichum gorgonifer TaxID=2041049 RepID=A0AAE8SYB3_9PEZI|nr:related to mitochondrial serine--tRNA ligase [Cephalotrichum gorgonifer]
MSSRMTAKRASARRLQFLYSRQAFCAPTYTPFRGISSNAANGSDSAADAISRRPTTAPKPIIDVRHIRENPDLYARNCTERNYPRQATYPPRIVALFSRWKDLQSSSRALREESNAVEKALKQARAMSKGGAEGEGSDGGALLERARAIKKELQAVEETEGALTDEMNSLAVSLPNITSDETPRGDEPKVLCYINDPPPPPKHDGPGKSHVDIGTELGILDFASAGGTSGWGFYYLLNEGAQLEQALTQYALAVAAKHGWGRVSPPTMVYDFVAEACGFQPRDQNGEQQIYGITRGADDAAKGRPGLCLTGTSEIPLAGMKASSSIPVSSLPLKRVASSRCYRAEAGARGVDTKGLYRVHEFTKVELFAWTEPDAVSTTEIFDEVLDIQTEILHSLGLYCRVLEMPSTDLGASATRKCDMETYFPSRSARNGGWGEVTSASVCTDYQTRRLCTRLKDERGKVAGFPWTINGTALAVPRVIAAILETGWDEESKSVVIPECLRPWMDGRERIGGK